MPEREIEFLIVGGGDAGFAAAQKLREEGADGSILVVSRDPDPPYDRTAVSKGFLGGEKSREDVTARRRRLVQGQRRRVAQPHERDEARPRGAHGHALQQGRDPLRQAAARHRRERPPAALRRLRPRRHPLPARARQRRLDPHGHRERRARRAGGRLLHRHRGRGDADRARPQVRDRDAGGHDARAHVRQAGRRVLPEGADRPRRRGPRRRGRRALRGRGPRGGRRHEVRAEAARRRGDRRCRRLAGRDAGVQGRA